MRLLARREHSVLEMKLKLARRGFQAKDVDPLVESLVKENLLSDSRFASEYARSRHVRGFGPLRIGAELRQKGVDSAVVEVSLAPFAEEWLRQATLQRRKRFGMGLPGEWKQKMLQMQFLTNRGFTAEQARRAVEEELEP